MPAQASAPHRGGIVQPSRRAVMSELLAHIPFQPTPPAPQEWIIEPLRRGDTAAVTELFDGMSARSRQQRFHNSVPRLSSRMLAFLSDVDGERHIAVAAWVRGRCVGIARAVVSRDRADVADVAVAVADAHQRQGLGRRLIDALTTDARAIGIREFEGTIHPGNDAARGLARSMAATASYDEGMVQARLSLTAAVPSPA
jgi:GNAT superfamily N-acetyltransferase